MKKRERQRFVKEAQALLLSLGAVQNGDDFGVQWDPVGTAVGR